MLKFPTKIFNRPIDDQVWQIRKNLKSKYMFGRIIDQFVRYFRFCSNEWPVGWFKLFLTFFFCQNFSFFSRCQFGQNAVSKDESSTSQNCEIFQRSEHIELKILFCLSSDLLKILSSYLEPVHKIESENGCDRNVEW